MRRMWRFTHGDERGAIFLATLVLVTIMTILGVALFSLSRIEGALAIGDAGSNQLLYCAEAALGRSMADFTAGGRMAQISGALGTIDTTITLTPNPQTVTTFSPGALTCSTTVIFTTPHSPTDCAGGVSGGSLTCGRLQATATAPDGTKRRVRVQLQNLSFQPWNLPGGTNDLNQNGAPYWDRASLEGSNFNIGDWIANSGVFAGSTVGPGAIPFWGQTYNATTDPAPGILPGLTANTGDYCAGAGVGCANPNILFAKGNGGQPNQVTLMAQWTNTGTVGTDHFGWFESDASGTIGPTHEIVNGSSCNGGGNGNCASPTAVSFTPTTNYYGFYLTNSRGTHYTLAGLAASSGYASNRFTPAPNDCPGCSNPGPAGNVGCTDPGCPASSSLPWIAYQHFTVFRQDAITYWIGLEDLYNLGHGIKCTCPAGQTCPPTAFTPTDGPGTSCIYRTNVDQDYQDMIIKLKVPNGDRVLNLNPAPPIPMDSRAWKDWQECSVSAIPPAC